MRDRLRRQVRIAQAHEHRVFEAIGFHHVGEFRHAAHVRAHFFPAGPARSDSYSAKLIVVRSPATARGLWPRVVVWPRRQPCYRVPGGRPVPTLPDEQPGWEVTIGLLANSRANSTLVFTHWLCPARFAGPRNFRNLQVSSKMYCSRGTLWPTNPAVPLPPPANRLSPARAWCTASSSAANCPDSIARRGKANSASASSKMSPRTPGNYGSSTPKW